VRLLRQAKAEHDWDLCKELARFLMALDESGETLRRTLELVEIKSPGAAVDGTMTPAFTFETATLGVPRPGRRRTNGGTRELGLGIGYDGGAGTSGSSRGGSSRSRSPTSPAAFATPGEDSRGDYFGGAGR
jgi:hypothetical protein